MDFALICTHCDHSSSQSSSHKTKNVLKLATEQSPRVIQSRTFREKNSFSATDRQDYSTSRPDISKQTGQGKPTTALRGSGTLRISEGHGWYQEQPKTNAKNCRDSTRSVYCIDVQFLYRLTSLIFL